MRLKLSLLMLVVFAGFAFREPEIKPAIPEAGNRELFNACGLEGCLDFSVFEKSMEGVNRFHPNKPVLAICDFSKPSVEKRFFLIDLEARKLLVNTLVAHGKNSGELMAERFSNVPESLQSSKGFYRVGEVIQSPKHGVAVLLEGLEKGVNDLARKREIIIHGAHYVSEDFIQAHGRLGRSFGCPALPQESMKEVVPLISDGALLYVFGN